MSITRRLHSRAPGCQHRAWSECLRDQRADQARVGFAGRPRDLLAASEDDERALVLDAKLLQHVFRGVKVDLIDNEIRLFSLDLLNDRPLLPAGRAP